MFNMDIIHKPGMDSLYDLVEIPSWSHLFKTKSPVLHEEKMREFYYNINFYEDDNISSKVNNHRLKLYEDLLGTILSVPRDGIKSVVGRTCSVEFVKEYSKIPNARCAGLQKKLMKGGHQLVLQICQ